MTARTVAAIFDATVAPYIAKVLEMQRATQEFSRQVSLAATKNQADWNRIGGGALKAGGLIAGGLALVTTAAVQWESEFAGVAKTVGGTQTQLASLDGQLRGLARTMASSHEEIAAVAANAGALGVKSQDIARFTRTMLMLGETTNLSADQASTSIAQLMTIMGTAPDQVDKLGAVLVRLGNNGASTEAQIVELSQRLAGASRAIGLNEAQVMGWSSAIASTGMNVEAGGTAMSKVFTKLDRLVQGNSDKLQVLNQVTGTDFAQAFRTDASGAVLDLVQSLGTLQAKGGSITKVLDALGIRGVYEADALRRLAGAGSLAAEQLGYANDEMSKGTALLVAYQKRQETAAAQVKIAWNNIQDSAIDAGQAFLPMVADGAKGVTDMARSFAGLPGPVKASATSLAGTAAAALLITGVGMKAAGVITNLSESYRKLSASSPKAAAGMRGALAASVAITVATVALNAYGAAVEDAAAKVRAKADNLSVGLLTAFNQGKGYDLKFDVPVNLIPTLDDPAGSMRITGIQDALKRAYSGDSWVGFQDWVAEHSPLGTSTGKLIREQVGEYDRALAALAQSGNSQAAAAGFNQLKDAATAAQVPLANLLPSLTEYRSQLEQTADALGLQGQISEQEYVDWMGGKIPTAINKAKAGGGDLINNLSDQQKAMIDVTKPVSDYTAELWEAANAALKLSGTRIGFEAAIDDTTSTIKGNQKRRGKGTKVGDSTSMNYAVNRDNKRALDDLATASQKYVDTLVDQGASTTKVVDVTQRARDKYIAAAKAAGYGADEAARMADDMGLIPSDVKAVIQTKLDREAIDEWKAYKPGDKWPRIRPKLTQSTFDVTLKTVWRINGGPKFSEAAGGILHVDKGRLVQRFATGGYLAPIGAQQPQIQPNRGPRGIQWAETGAGPWEAFVSGHPAKAARSRDITSEVAHRLGGDIEWRNASGGIRDWSQQSVADWSQQDRTRFAGRPMTVNVTTNYPIAEPTSVTANRAMAMAARIGRL